MIKRSFLTRALPVPCALFVGLSLLPGATATPSAPPAAPAAFDPTALRPYFESGPLAEADRRLHAEDTQGAIRGFSAYLKEHPSAADQKQARFLLGLSLLHENRKESALEAAHHFDRLSGKYPLLSSYHALYAARGYLLGGQPREALSRAQKVPADSVLDCEARFLRGQARTELAQREDAVAEYQAYVKDCDGRHRFEAKAQLAELFTALSRPDEALSQWRSLYLEAPTEALGEKAERFLEQAGNKVPPLLAAEMLSRAQVLFDNMRNVESEIAYRRVLEARDVKPEQVCVAKFQLAQSVFKQRQRQRAAALFDEAVPLCASGPGPAPGGAKNDDLHMKALYQSARCHGARGELQQAADLFAQAEAAHPDHSYADDARIRQAEMYADLQEKLGKQGAQKTCQDKTCPDYEARLTRLLAELPDKFPAGDQRAEALFRLAFRSYLRKDYAGSRRYLLDCLQRVPRESGWDQEGRTLYWLGRLSDLLGNGADALGYYRRAATEYPLSYYSLQSFNRLGEKMPGELDRLLGELTKEPAGPEAEAAQAWHFKQRPLFGQPAFLRGVELARLGLGPEARQELFAAGIKVPMGKGHKISDPDEEELLWLAAVLYNRAGEWYLSHFIPRHTLTGYQRHYPVGAFRKLWLLSYPRGYEELLTEAAHKNGQPEGLQFAIVREESAFDPLNESFANAIGLTQMIPPTARRFSAGLPTTREALRDPAINVAIGARFLGFLWSTMQQNPVLSIAGYNAGEGAVFRWLAARGDMDLDAWVESIPYDETRGYTKRVLGSFLTYNWLAPGGAGEVKARIPVIPLKTPALPGKRPPAREGGSDADPHRK